MRKSSKSLRKSSSQKPTRKKQCSKKCLKKQMDPLNIQDSLYRKYPSTQNYHYISSVNMYIEGQKIVKETRQEVIQECLEKYYKSLTRKHLFPKIKEVYKMHKEIPKISQPQVKQILDKCYHKKRLLQYFKIAKVLGIKVDSVKLSTFLLSVSNNITIKNLQPQKNYQPIITQISTIDFSNEVERNLLEEFFIHDRKYALQNKENSIYASNTQIRIQKIGISS